MLKPISEKTIVKNLPRNITTINIEESRLESEDGAGNLIYMMGLMVEQEFAKFDERGNGWRN